MKSAEAILSVKFKSTLDPVSLMEACEGELEAFKNVPGLLQKYYISEESTGALSGFYIFENTNARTAFMESKLAKNIPSRYGVIQNTLRVEQYEMALVLHDAFFA